MGPLVSIICLCYNQARFLESAIISVLNQSYTTIEIIIIDDNSSDESVSIINSLIAKFPSIHFIKNEINIGMCRSFNKAFKEAKGEFVIDFACDDMMAPSRIEEQVKAFSMLSEKYGVVFSDAYIVNEKGEKTNTFYKRNQLGVLIDKVPYGDVFKDIIHSYQICSPTIMIRKKVLDELFGYNESLSYEDYDFFIRSSRNYLYYYIDKPLTYHRKVSGSDSSSWYRKSVNVHLESTLEVCKNAILLCRNKEEINALLHSIRYHLRQSFFVECFELVLRYHKLLVQLESNSFVDDSIMKLARARVKVNFLFKFYQVVFRIFQ